MQVWDLGSLLSSLLDGHREPIAGDQCAGHVNLGLVSWHKAGGKAPGEHSQENVRFKQREIVADTDALASSKRMICIGMLGFFAIRSPAIRVEGFRIRPKIRVAVREVRDQQYR